MKKGKVSENILKRSVLKPMKPVREDVLKGSGIGRDGAIIRADEVENVMLTTNALVWNGQKTASRMIHSLCNNLACEGAEPVGIMVNIVLPEDAEESCLRIIMESMQDACSPMGIDILGGHTEVSSAVLQPMVIGTGIGKSVEKGNDTLRGMVPGDDIIVTKWIALEGTFLAAEKRLEELKTRYPMFLLQEAADFYKYLSVVPEAGIAVSHGAHALHDLSRGGVFGALWEMAAGAGVGVEVELKKIPIRQETVEVCEFCGLNPYQLASAGSLLIAVSDGIGMVEKLEQAGIPAVIIGKATNGNNRVIINEDEKRFLDLPQVDEIHKVFK